MVRSRARENMIFSTWELVFTSVLVNTLLKEIEPLGFKKEL